MKRDDVDRGAVLRTINKMLPTFNTKDLSGHADMVAAHSAVKDRNYHADIGKFLSLLSAQPGSPVKKEPNRHWNKGQQWSRR